MNDDTNFHLVCLEAEVSKMRREVRFMTVCVVLMVAAQAIELLAGVGMSPLAVRGAEYVAELLR